MMKHTLYILALLFVCFTNAQTSQELFEEGNALYRENKFEAAITAYSKILDEQQASKDLYFNMANAYYKINKIGPSIYYYEKALLLNPTDVDVLNNLSFAKKMTIDRIDVMPKSFVDRISQATMLKLHPNVWAVMAIIFSFLSVLFFLVYRISNKLRIKKLTFVLGLVLLLFMLLSFTFSLSAKSYRANNRQGIVFSQQVEVKEAPTEISDEIFQLHEGTKVYITDKVEDWLQIKLTDGKVGWLKRDSIKAL